MMMTMMTLGINDGIDDDEKEEEEEEYDDKL